MTSESIHIALFLFGRIRNKCTPLSTYALLKILHSCLQPVYKMDSVDCILRTAHGAQRGATTAWFGLLVAENRVCKFQTQQTSKNNPARSGKINVSGYDVRIHIQTVLSFGTFQK